MARSRNIKPSIMDNEDLAALPALTRLLFIYMWMLADRDGRMEDRPARIKKQALGYDDGSADEMLNQLVGAGFIERYEVNGVKVIQVSAFNKHQTPHLREAASELPCKAQVPAQNAQSTNLGSAEHQPSTNLGSAEASPRSPDTPFLIPDTGYLIPDSLHSVPSGTGGKPPLTPDEIIFGYGVPILSSAGTPEKQARSFLGGLRKAHGDGALVDALRECIRAKPLQPLEWLAKALPPLGKGASKTPNRQEALEARNRALAEEMIAEFNAKGAEIEAV